MSFATFESESAGRFYSNIHETSVSRCLPRRSRKQYVHTWRNRRTPGGDLDMDDIDSHAVCPEVGAGATYDSSPPGCT